MAALGNWAELTVAGLTLLATTRTAAMEPSEDEARWAPSLLEMAPPPSEGPLALAWSACLTSQKLLAEYKRDTTNLVGVSPDAAAPQSVTLLRFTGQAFTCNAQGAEDPDGASKLLLHLCTAALLTSLPHPLYAFDRIWPSLQEFLHQWQSGLRVLQSIGTTPRSPIIPSPITGRPKLTLLYAGVEARQGELLVSVHPKRALHYSLARLIGNYRAQHASLAAAHLHLSNSRLGSQERDRVAPWHEGGEAAEDTMSIGLPEVSATAELRREAGGSRRNVQVCATVQEMDTAVTHRMLNQVILLHSKLQREGVEVMGFLQRTHYAPAGAEVPSGPRSTPEPRGSPLLMGPAGPPVRWTYGVRLLLRGVRLTAVSVYTALTMDTGPVGIRVWKNDPAADSMQWTVELRGSSMVLRDVSAVDPARGKAPGEGQPTGGLGAPPAATPSGSASRTPSGDFGPRSGSVAGAAPLPSRAGARGGAEPLQFEWGRIAGQATVGNVPGPSPEVCLAPALGRQQSRTRRMVPEVTLTAPDAPHPPTGAAVAQLYVDIRNTKLLLRPGCWPQLALLVEGYRAEFHKFMAEVQGHQAQARRHVGQLPVAKQLASFFEEQKQHLDELAQDPGALLSRAKAHVTISNVCVMMPVGEHLFVGMEQVSRWAAADCLVSRGKGPRGGAMHVHTIDCLDRRRCVATVALLLYVRSVSLSTLAGPPDTPASPLAGPGPPGPSPSLGGREASSSATFSPSDAGPKKATVCLRIRDVLCFFDEGSPTMQSAALSDHVFGGKGCFTFNAANFDASRTSCRLTDCRFQLHVTLHNRDVVVKAAADFAGPLVKLSPPGVLFLEEAAQELFSGTKHVGGGAAHRRTSSVGSGAAEAVGGSAPWVLDLSLSVDVQQGEGSLLSLRPLPTGFRANSLQRSGSLMSMSFPRARGPKAAAAPADLLLAVPLQPLSVALSYRQRGAATGTSANGAFDREDQDHRILLSLLVRSQDVNIPPTSVLFWKEVGQCRAAWPQDRQGGQAQVVALLAAAGPGPGPTAVPLPTAWVSANLVRKCVIRRKYEKAPKAAGTDHSPYYFVFTGRVLPFRVAFTCSPMAETYLSLRLADHLDCLATVTNGADSYFLTARDFTAKLSGLLKAECCSLEVPRIRAVVLRQSACAPALQSVAVDLGNVRAAFSSAHLHQLYTFYLLWQSKAQEAQTAMAEQRPPPPPPPPASQTGPPASARAPQLSTFWMMNAADMSLQVYDASYDFELTGQGMRLHGRWQLTDFTALSRKQVSELCRAFLAGAPPPEGPRPAARLAVQAVDGRLGPLVLRCSKRLNGDVSLAEGCAVRLVRRLDAPFFHQLLKTSSCFMTQLTVEVPRLTGGLDVLGMRTVLKLLVQQLRLQVGDVVDGTGRLPYSVRVCGCVVKCHTAVSHDTVRCVADLLRSTRKVRAEQRQEAERRLRFARPCPRAEPPPGSPATPSAARRAGGVPAGEVRLQCQDGLVSVADKAAVVQFTVAGLGVEFAETPSSEEVTRVFLLSADKWGLSRQNSQQPKAESSICVACNGPMTVMLFTKRGLQPDAVTYQFSTKFGAQLETGANMADLKATTDTLRQLFGSTKALSADLEEATDHFFDDLEGPAAPAPPVAPKLRYVAEQFDFAPEVKWLGPLTAPFQTFLSWLGLSYEALPVGLDALCSALEGVLRRLHGAVAPAGASGGPAPGDAAVLTVARGPAPGPKPPTPQAKSRPSSSRRPRHSPAR
eukprot:EG_transcript_190